MKESRLLFAIEIVAFAAAAVLTSFWIGDPAGPYEPWTVACGLVGLGIDLARRAREKQRAAVDGSDRPWDHRLTYAIVLGATALMVLLVHHVMPEVPWWITFGLVVTPVGFVFLGYTVPGWVGDRRKTRLGQLALTVMPDYFRLEPRPMLPAEHANFDREDGVHRRIAQWVADSHWALLYLTGRSGCGKSSIVNAYLPFALQGAGIQCILVRGFADPVAEIRRLLGEPGNAWERPPNLSGMLARDMLEKAASYLNGQKRRLILVFDQFEELFLLEDRQPGQLQSIVDLLISHSGNPIGNLSILLVTRFEFIGRIETLDLPRLVQSDNWRDVPAFTKSAGRAFLVAGNIPDEHVAGLIEQAAELDEMALDVRPITINMLGLIYRRDSVLGGQLSRKRGAQRGLLLHYLHKHIRSGDLKDIGPKVLRVLINKSGIRTAPQSELEIADMTALSAATVNGALRSLQQEGVVRPIGATRWEISHDFLATQLNVVLEQIHHSLGQLLKRWAPAAAVILSFLGVFVVAFFWKAQQDSVHQMAREYAVRMERASASIRNTEPLLSLLLAAEAARVVANDQTILNNLRNALDDCSGQPLTAHAQSVKAIAISPDNHWLVTGGNDGKAILWRLSDGPVCATESKILLAPDETPGSRSILAVAFSYDSHWVAVARSKTVYVCDLRSNDRKIVPLEGLAEPLAGHNGQITQLQFTKTDKLVSAGMDGLICVWPMKRRSPADSVILRGHSDEVQTIAVDSTGRWLVTAGNDGVVAEWDLEDAVPQKSLRRLYSHRSLVNSVAISEDGWMASAGDDRKVILSKLANKPVNQRIELVGHEDTILRVAFSHPHSDKSVRWLATASADKTVRLWDLATILSPQQPQPYRIFRTHEGWVRNLAFTADNQWLLTASADKTVRCWTMDFGKELFVLRGHQGEIRSMATSTVQKKWLATGADDAGVRIWDLSTSNPLRARETLAGHTDSVLTTGIDPSGRWALTGGAKGGARLWDLNAAERSTAFQELAANKGWVTTLAIGPTWLVTASDADTANAILWKLGRSLTETAKPMCLVGHKEGVHAVALGQRQLITGSDDGTARVWHLDASAPSEMPIVLSRAMFPEFGHKDWVRAVAMSPSEDWVLTGSHDSTACLWRVVGKSARPVHLLNGHTGPITTAAFISNDKVVTAGADGAARIWYFTEQSKTLLHILNAHAKPVTAVAATTDGHWLVTASDDMTAKLWNLRSDRPDRDHRELKGHAHRVTDAAISPNNRWLVTGCCDGIARLWDLTMANPASSAQALKGHKSFILSVDVSDTTVITGSADRTAQLWDLQTDKLIERANAAAGRTLTADERQRFDVTNTHGNESR